MTGYLIPTLLKFNQIEMAEKAADWLVRIQNPDGGWGGLYWPRGQSCVFDTGMILIGLVEAKKMWFGFDRPIRRATEFLENVDLEEKFQDHEFVPSYHARVGWPLKVLGSEKWTEYRDLALDRLDDDLWPRRVMNGTSEPISHFLIYVIRGLYEIGEGAMAKAMMMALSLIQREDGSIPMRVGPGWEEKSSETCVPAVAQAGILWEKLGMVEESDRAMSYLRSQDLPLWASDPKGGEYLPHFSPSWLHKFVLDFIYERVKRDE